MESKYLHQEPSTNGLAAHYKLWAELTATTVFDYSLNGFPGVVDGTDIAPTYPGFSCNGTDDNITLDSGPTSVKTVAMWVKPDDIAGTDYPIGLNTTDYLAIVTGTLTINGFAGGTAIRYVDGVTATAVTANWHLIGITNTNAKAASAASMGSRVSATFFAGIIGETRLYDRVLTPAEMRSVYELTRWRYLNN